MKEQIAARTQARLEVAPATALARYRKEQRGRYGYAIFFMLGAIVLVGCIVFAFATGDFGEDGEFTWLVMGPFVFFTASVSFWQRAARARRERAMLLLQYEVEAKEQAVAFAHSLVDAEEQQALAAAAQRQAARNEATALLKRLQDLEGQKEALARRLK